MRARVVDSPRARVDSPPAEVWSVVWHSRYAPIMRRYLWTVGFQTSAEEALTVAEQKAVGEGEEERRSVISPARDPNLDVPVAHRPEIRRGIPHWAVIWISRVRPHLRSLLFGDPQRSWESALEAVQRELVLLGSSNPPLARSYCHGTFYPVRMDMRIEGVKGTFYPVLVSAGLEVLEDPMVGRVVEGGG